MTQTQAQDEALRTELLQMQAAERALRDKLQQAGGRYEGYDATLESLHLQQAERLHQIIEAQGWPGQSRVGRDAAYAAFNIAKNAISNPPLQRSFLIALSQAAQSGEATAIQAACLQDRILYNEGKPQRLGMLFDWDAKGELCTQVIDIEQANAERRALGLESIAEALALHRRTIETEGGGPPRDIEAHRRLTQAWAERVGWRSPTQT